MTQTLGGKGLASFKVRNSFRTFGAILAGHCFEVALTRHQPKHETWCGRRFVNVQAKSEDGRLAQPGTRAIFVLVPVR